MGLLGEHAPDFTLESTAGKDVTLAETLETGPTVIVLFRAAWCSYCAEQLKTFSELADALAYYHDTDVLPVSGDALGNLVEMRDRHDLRIQLLSDPDFEATRAYTGIEEHEAYGRYTHSGTFIVDPDGLVRYEQIADAAPDRTYANFCRYFIKRDYEDAYGTTSGTSA